MRLLLSLFVAVAPLYLAKANDSSNPCVVLLHGLARSPASMAPLAKSLEVEGYQVVNYGYESTQYSVAELAVTSVEAALEQCEGDGPANFVTHSMGGILLRHYALEKGPDRIGRAVMLGPPNQGSEVVDKLGGLWLFSAVNGPAGKELGTAADSVPNALGPVEFELGVIAGTSSFNPLFSSWLPEADDGKVSVASAKVDGMSAFRTVPHTHTFMMRADIVLAESATFLRTGRFECPDQAPESVEVNVCEMFP